MEAFVKNRPRTRSIRQLAIDELWDQATPRSSPISRARRLSPALSRLVSPADCSNPGTAGTSLRPLFFASLSHSDHCTFASRIDHRHRWKNLGSIADSEDVITEEEVRCDADGKGRVANDESLHDRRVVGPALQPLFVGAR